MRRAFTVLALALGLGLLALVLHQADLRATWTYLVRLGAWGPVAVVVFAAASVACESASWMLTLTAVAPTVRWWARAMRVLLVGQLLEVLTPLAWLGGDSAKALLLRRRYGISLRTATSSLVLSRTTDVASLLVFTSVGLLLMARDDAVPATLQRVAAGALATLMAFAALFFSAQWYRPTRRLVPLAATSRRPVVVRLRPALDAARDVEARVAAAYSAHPARLALSTVASLGEWLSGALLTWVALGLFGTPVTLAEAVVIDAAALLVRAALFFVPGDIGTQDAALLLACTAYTGSPAAGLALAAVHRARDVLVLSVGLVLALSMWRENARTEARP